MCFARFHPPYAHPIKLQTDLKPCCDDNDKHYFASSHLILDNVMVNINQEETASGNESILQDFSPNDEAKFGSPLAWIMRALVVILVITACLSFSMFVKS